MDEEIKFRGKLLKGSRYEPLVELSLARWNNEPKNDKGEAFLTQGMIGEVIGMPRNTYLQRDILEYLSRYPLICTYFNKGDKRGRLFREREAEHLPVTKISEKIEKNLKSEGKGQET